MSLINSTIVTAKIKATAFDFNGNPINFKVVIRRGGFCFSRLTGHFPTRERAEAYAATRKQLVANLEAK